MASGSATGRVQRMTENPCRNNQAVTPSKFSTSSLSIGVESIFESSFLRNFECDAIKANLDAQNIPDHLYNLEGLASYMDLHPPFLSSQDTVKRIFRKILPFINVIGPSQVRGFCSLDVLHVVNKVLPDILISPIEGAYPVVLIEVQSKGYVQTIRKLYLELYLHLITLRNRIPCLKKISGFVVPKETEKLGTVVATVTWESEYIRFAASLRRLSMSQFSAEVCRVYKDQRNLLLVPVARTHSLPVTIGELESFLHITEVQGFFHSKFSVIFYTKYHVWKCPLVHNSLGWIIPPTTSKQVLYRERTVDKFYVFKRLIDPIELEIIKLKCLRCFAISLYRAIEEIHSHGYAHQDIRLPNICFNFNREECYVVLIDLDQADFVNCSPVLKRNSFMYSTTLNTSGKIDWRQYSLLITAIRNGRSEDNYHRTPPDFTGLRMATNHVLIKFHVV